MKNSMPVVCLAKAIRLYAYAIAATLTMIIPQLSHGQCTPKAESVSGFVYEDVNNDGIKAVDESGIANVQVAAFNGSGQQIGSALTLADGSYIIENLTDGSKVRLVFYLFELLLFIYGWQGQWYLVQFHQVPVRRIPWIIPISKQLWLDLKLLQHVLFKEISVFTLTNPPL